MRLPSWSWLKTHTSMRASVQSLFRNCKYTLPCVSKKMRDQFSSVQTVGLSSSFATIAIMLYYSVHAREFVLLSNKAGILPLPSVNNNPLSEYYLIFPPRITLIKEKTCYQFVSDGVLYKMYLDIQRQKMDYGWC